MVDISILNISVDEQVNVEITQDKMFGVIWFSPPENGGRILTYSEVLRAIQEKGIVAGINEEYVRELTIDKKYEYKYIVARGEMPENGTDAKITLAFDPEELNKLKPRENEDGTVDFKDLDSVRNVKKGEVLAKKTPATQGIDGFNVLGQKLNAKRGKDLRLPKGKNTIILEDQLTLAAALEGKLEYEDEKISISTVWIITGDVDNSTGNIDFLGNVIINGMVHSGFTVKAKGSVEVRGSVEGAIIIAGGDIVLRYGVQGTETSRLEAGGNIVAKFIQNAYIQAEKDIITEGIWHSTVNAGGVIKADVGKGSIIGGSVSATNVVLAKNIGSPMGTLTGIQIGIQPCVYTEYRELAEIIRRQKTELSNIEKEILYIKTKSIGAAADPFKQKKLEKLISERQRLLDKLQEDSKKYTVLDQRIEGVKDGAIKVFGKMYPGTKIVMGNTTKYIDHIYTNCVFTKSFDIIYADNLIDSFAKIGTIVSHKKEADDDLYAQDSKNIRYIKNT